MKKKVLSKTLAIAIPLSLLTSTIVLGATTTQQTAVSTSLTSIQGKVVYEDVNIDADAIKSAITSNATKIDSLSDSVSSISVEATNSVSGLMSATDKAKLDGIATGANKYSLPKATATTLGGVKIGSNITVSDGSISLTKANVTTALGYTPPTTDTNTTTGDGIKTKAKQSANTSATTVTSSIAASTTLDSALKTLLDNDQALKKSVSDGKKLVADAITAKGITTATDATYQQMAENINNIKSLMDVEQISTTMIDSGSFTVTIPSGTMDNPKRGNVKSIVCDRDMLVNIPSSKSGSPYSSVWCYIDTDKTSSSLYGQTLYAFKKGETIKVMYAGSTFAGDDNIRADGVSWNLYGTW